MANANNTRDGNGRASTGSGENTKYAEGNLGSAWRKVMQGAIVVTNQAKKTVASAGNTQTSATMQKDLHDKTKELLIFRKEFGKTITSISDRLEGKAAEMDCLNHYVNTHPLLGKKRKRQPEIITLD